MKNKQPSFRFESKEFEQAKEKIRKEYNKITVSNPMGNTAKAEAIREAWLEFLSEEDFKKLVLDEEGFSNYQCRRYIHQSKWNDLYSRFIKNSKTRTGSDLIYRPKSLQGIEHNNGWIRIESEKDLPKEDKIVCHLIINNDRMELNGGFRRYSKETFYFFNAKGEGFLIDSVTHWQPIVKHEKPIY